MGSVAIVIPLALIMGSFVAIALANEARLAFGVWMANRAALAKQEHQTRRIEALAQMDDLTRLRLLESKPDWLDLDLDNPTEVEAWKRATAEATNTRDYS